MAVLLVLEKKDTIAVEVIFLNCCFLKNGNRSVTYLTVFVLIHKHFKRLTQD